MNMLPINAEWKRRIKWVDEQRKKRRTFTQPTEKIKEQARGSLRGK